MKPLSTSNDPVEQLIINEVTYTIDYDQVNTQFKQTQNSSYHQSESTNDLKPVPKTSILMHSAIQIHRQVPLTDTKISKKTKNKLYEMLQNYKNNIKK